MTKKKPEKQGWDTCDIFFWFGSSCQERCQWSRAKTLKLSHDVSQEFHVTPSCSKLDPHLTQSARHHERRDHELQAVSGLKPMFHLQPPIPTETPGSWPFATWRCWGSLLCSRSAKISALRCVMRLKRPLSGPCARAGRRRRGLASCGSMLCQMLLALPTWRGAVMLG